MKTILLILWLLTTAATMPGTYRATIVRIVDGDTFLARTQIWIGIYAEDAIRLKDIDTPEKGAFAKCDREKRMGEMATDFTRARIRVGDVVTLSEVRADKYRERVDAKVQLADGRDLGSILIHAGVAKLYDGSGPKPDWCNDKN